MKRSLEKLKNVEVQICAVDSSQPMIDICKKNINRKEIMNYYNKYYTPDNLMISFSGCFHSGYITIIEKHFTHALATNYKNKINS